MDIYLQIADQSAGSQVLRRWSLVLVYCYGTMSARHVNNSLHRARVSTTFSVPTSESGLFCVLPGYKFVSMMYKNLPPTGAFTLSSAVPLPST